MNIVILCFLDLVTFNGHFQALSKGTIPVPDVGSQPFEVFWCGYTQFEVTSGFLLQSNPEVTKPILKNIIVIAVK
jgi:hypothetical protein